MPLLPSRDEDCVWPNLRHDVEFSPNCVASVFFAETLPLLDDLDFAGISNRIEKGYQSNWEIMELSSPSFRAVCNCASLEKETGVLESRQNKIFYVCCLTCITS